MSAPTALVTVCALGAAASYAVANVLEQRQASQAPSETSLRISLLWFLARRPAWWLGIAADLSGFALQAVALGLGSIVFVQPLLVSSLLFALLLGWAVGSHHLTWGDLAWAVAFVVALATFLVVSNPTQGLDQRPVGAWLVPGAAGAVAVTAGLVVARSVRPAYRSALLATAAGVCFGFGTTFTKSAARQLGDQGPSALLHHWEPWALAAVLPFGFLLVQSAFQAGDLKAALPTVNVAEPVVAVLLGVTVLQERVRASGAPGLALLAASVALMAVSVVQLARSAADLREPAPDPTPGPAPPAPQ